MKKRILQFLISKSGGVITPIIAGIVASLVAKLAVTFPEVAATVNQAEVTAFVWGLLLAAVNLWTNEVQTAGGKALQTMIDESPAFPPATKDGWVGPNNQAVLAKAIAIVEESGQHIAPARPVRKKAGWWK
jgi:uncharacterized membrane protein YeaQ/YmgE (transglycosylase-associated protein family)